MCRPVRHFSLHGSLGFYNHRFECLLGHPPMRRRPQILTLIETLLVADDSVRKGCLSLEFPPKLAVMVVYDNLVHSFFTFGRKALPKSLLQLQGCFFWTLHQAVCSPLVVFHK